jgi:hypothetical protein
LIQVLYPDLKIQATLVKPEDQRELDKSQVASLVKMGGDKGSNFLTKDPMHFLTVLATGSVLDFKSLSTTPTSGLKEPVYLQSGSQGGTLILTDGWHRIKAFREAHKQLLTLEARLATKGLHTLSTEALARYNQAVKKIEEEGTWGVKVYDLGKSALIVYYVLWLIMSTFRQD